MDAPSPKGLIYIQTEKKERYRASPVLHYHPLSTIIFKVPIIDPDVSSTVTYIYISDGRASSNGLPFLLNHRPLNNWPLFFSFLSFVLPLALSFVLFSNFKESSEFYFVSMLIFLTFLSFLIYKELCSNCFLFVSK